jgi:hypothetical protein
LRRSGGGFGLAARDRYAFCPPADALPYVHLTDHTLKLGRAVTLSASARKQATDGFPVLVGLALKTQYSLRVVLQLLQHVRHASILR